jgi:hypothetical protein
VFIEKKITTKKKQIHNFIYMMHKLVSDEQNQYMRVYANKNKVPRKQGKIKP